VIILFSIFSSKCFPYHNYILVVSYFLNRRNFFEFRRCDSSGRWWVQRIFTRENDEEWKNPQCHETRILLGKRACANTANCIHRLRLVEISTAWILLRKSLRNLELCRNLFQLTHDLLTLRRKTFPFRANLTINSIFIYIHNVIDCAKICKIFYSLHFFLRKSCSIEIYRT